MVITTRAFNEDTDTGIIRDTMPKAIYFDTHPRRGRPNKTWFESFDSYLMGLIKVADIVVATSEDDSDFILGYAIFHDSKLEFIYVKDVFRKQGICKMLFGQRPFTTINESNMTKLGKQILEQQFKTQEDGVKKQAETATTTIDQSQIDRLIEGGFKIKKVTFQSAVVGGFGTAEFQFSSESGNKTRVPDKLHWTPAGVVVEQNGERFITPLANVIQGNF